MAFIPKSKINLSITVQELSVLSCFNVRDIDSTDSGNSLKHACDILLHLVLDYYVY